MIYTFEFWFTNLSQLVNPKNSHGIQTLHQNCSTVQYLKTKLKFSLISP